MKFDQDLFENLRYDLKKYFDNQNSTLGSVVHLAMFLQAVPASCTMFGGGAWIEDEGCEEKDADLPGSQDLSERGLRGGGGGR